jgi:hypothetical protein|uniref:Uncharacterized protein n=1 Tax=Populus trichocarpa TaxID=3694 RepID=U5FSX6_POPTR
MVIVLQKGHDSRGSFRLGREVPMNKILVSSHLIAGDSVLTTIRVLILTKTLTGNLLVCQMPGSVPIRWSRTAIAEKSVSVVCIWFHRS